ncbi:hypothetical protein D3C75_621710 [compost metagenome]
MVVAGHQGELVVGVQIDDVVAAVEGAEEAHLEPRLVRTTDEVGFALGLAPAAIALQAAVEHLDAAVVTQAVGGAHPLQPPLEAVVETRDLVPGAEVAIELEAGDGADAVGEAGAGRQQPGGEQTKQ